jgi:hypothetical protein
MTCSTGGSASNLHGIRLSWLQVMAFQWTLGNSPEVAISMHITKCANMHVSFQGLPFERDKVAKVPCCKP